MKPTDSDNSTSTPHTAQPVAVSPDRTAAAELMRRQIDTLYDTEQTESPYRRTHSETADHTAAENQPHDMKQYHSAWQSYYQQYYERYYMAELDKRQQGTTPVPAAASKAAPAAAAQPLSREQVEDELRHKLVDTVKTRSQNVRSSRHFMPVVAGLTVAVAFAILQYNQLLVAQVRAYVSPGSINPANIVLDPTVETKVGPEAKIVIPKINVDAPVVYDVPSLAENVIQDKLRGGVVHYPIPGANSIPGQAGNTVLLGHSSNDVFDSGAYKFVFVQLDKLNTGDNFYLHYNGTRYTYSVTQKKIINPNQVSELVIDGDKPLATLVTCTPPGTALKRLVVIAEQISPDPAKVTAGPATTTSETNAPSIAGNAPTLFERLFNLD
ncbi:MAG TPA: sortase [Candidatus Saccharimonadales bacterium]|jgi:sortase A